MAAGDQDMPEIDVRMIGYSVYDSGTSYGPYTANHHEIVWVDEGSARLTNDGESWDLPPNSVVLSQQDDLNHYAWDPHQTTRHGFIHFNGDIDPENPGMGAPSPRVRHLRSDDIILALLHHLRWLDTERPHGWTDLAPHAVSYALRAFAADASQTSGVSSTPMPEPVERSLDLLRERWARGRPRDSPTLAELADAASVSPEHLCRIYKRTLGFGPIQAVRLLRLNRTIMLLARTNMTVGQVAQLGGFKSQFHFTHTFKRTIGVSPTEFRKNHEMSDAIPHAIRRLENYL